MAPFRSYEHVLRLAALFAVGVAVFVGLRWLLVPADYGQLGPYRAAAVAQNRMTPIVHAGQAACVDCHTDVADIRKAGAHARVSCESCHGPHAAHAEDPAVAARRPESPAVCAVCHLPNAAKPRDFKTVAFAEHADPGPCTACHQAHAPAP